MEKKIVEAFFENLDFGSCDPQSALWVAELWKWKFQLTTVYCFHNPHCRLQNCESVTFDLFILVSNFCNLHCELRKCGTQNLICIEQMLSDIRNPHCGLRVAERRNSKLKNFGHLQSALRVVDCGLRKQHASKKNSVFYNSQKV